MKKFEEKPTCSHCKKKGHEEEKCWKLHTEILPKKFQNKRKQNTVATTQQYIGSDLGNETKITTMGSKVISIFGSSSSVQSCKLESVLNQNK